jgi:hypothetical protein
VLGTEFEATGSMSKGSWKDTSAALQTNHHWRS